MKLQYFCICIYIWWLLNFLCGVFFVCGKPTDRPASIINKNPKIVIKTATCSYHCPLRHPAPSLGHWYTGVYLWIFIPGTSNPTTFLGLWIPGDYRQSIESSMCIPTFNSTEKALKFNIYDCILRLRPKKVWYLTKFIPLAAEFMYLATSAECSGPINRPTTVKGLTVETAWLPHMAII